MIDISAVHNIYNDMRNHDIVIAYSGDFNQDMLDAFLMLIEKKLEHIGAEKKAVKKVYNVMVECVQNIVKHSGNGDFGKENMLIISQKEDLYHIITGNCMEENKVCQLRKKLEYVNSLSKEELKEYYLQILQDGKISDKGGAGLGFIDMVKKTGNKLSYDFKSVPGGKIFFTLVNTVNC